MATSGSFNTSAYTSGSYNCYGHFEWRQTGQSVDGNYTDIAWTLTGVTASEYQWVQVYGISVTVNGQATGASWSGQMYNGTQMASGTARIYHNDDGTKSFSASANVQMYASGASYPGSGSWDLNKIEVPSKFYGSVSKKSKRVKKQYCPVNNKSRRLLKVYGSVGGKSKLIFRG